MIYLADKKAQALVELAIFGTILLGALGFFLTNILVFNYSENLNMQTFRWTLEKAYQERKTYNNVNLIVIDDRAYPEFNNPLAIPSRLPLISSNNAVWSNDLLLSWDKDDYGDREDLPQLTIRVIDKNESLGYREYNFTLAGWIHTGKLTPSMVREKKDDYKDEYLMDGTKCSDTDGDGDIDCDGIYWYWKTLTKIKEKKFENGNFDVDNDGKEEFILDYCDEKQSCLYEANVMDFQEGEIDSSINSADLKKDILANQGFVGDYQQITQINPATYLKRQEDKDKIVTTRSIDMSDDFYYWVRLNRITTDLINQMRANDIIMIGIDDEQDGIIDRYEIYNQGQLKNMDVSGYDGKKQGIWFGISKKATTKTYEQWTTRY